MEGNTHILSWLHSQVGVAQQVSQIVNKGYGFGNAFAPALATSANIFAGNFAGAAATIASEIGNAAASKIPSATTLGSNGGIDSLRGTPSLQYEFKLIVDEDNGHRGRPLCEMREISTLLGYIQVSKPTILAPTTKEEQEKIIDFMEGGFFNE
jgi:hypothetical protein